MQKVTQMLMMTLLPKMKMVMIQCKTLNNKQLNTFLYLSFLSVF